MWTWTNDNYEAAIYVTDEGVTLCGINAEPLASWIAEGNEPDPPNMSTTSNTTL